MLIFGLGYTASRLAGRLRRDGWDVIGTRRKSADGALAFDDDTAVLDAIDNATQDRKSTRLNSSHDQISYAVFCLKKKKTNNANTKNNKHTNDSATSRRTHRPRQNKNHYDDNNPQ